MISLTNDGRISFGTTPAPYTVWYDMMILRMPLGDEVIAVDVMSHT